MSEDLEKQMSAYPDVRLLNTIGQAKNFSAETVEMAKKIATERGLLDEAGMAFINNKVQIKRDAKTYIAAGMDPSKAVKTLIDTYGIKEKVAAQVVVDAAKSPSTYAKEETGSPIGAVLGFVVFILYLAFKLVVIFSDM